MYSGNDLKKETLIELEGVPYRVVEFSHHAMGRGGAVVRVKIKNLITGGVLEKSFRPTDKIQPAQIDRAKMQYLYRDGDNFEFMNQVTYDQESVPAEVLGDPGKYLPEGQEINLMIFNDKAIGAEIPNSLFLKVSHTEPGIKGDTASSAMKECEVETGVRVMVPLFINEGDVIKVDTRTGQYLERQK